LRRALVLALCLLAPLAWGEKMLPTNAATILAVGPFVDNADGVTPETAMTVTNITCELYTESDAGSAPTRTAITLAASGSDNDMVHITDDVAGYYSVELTAAQLNFLGRATLVFTDADVCLPVFVELRVVPAAVYNSLVAGTDNLQVDTTQVEGGDATDALGVAQTGDAYARLGAPAGASVSADIAAIEAQTDDIGAAGVGLTALASQASVDDLPTNAEFQARTLPAADYFDPATDAVSLVEGAIAAVTLAADVVTLLADSNIVAVNGVGVTDVTDFHADLSGLGTVDEVALAVWEILLADADDTAGSLGEAIKRIKAAVYDSATRSGTTITLSDGTTQVVDSSGRDTTEP
jgi:hypothetical protein